MPGTTTAMGLLVGMSVKEKSSKESRELEWDLGVHVLSATSGIVVSPRVVVLGLLVVLTGMRETKCGAGIAGIAGVVQFWS